MTVNERENPAVAGPTPRDFYSPRWTWTPDRCVACLKDWTAVTGSPPRAYEWTLRLPSLRALGLPVSGRQLWEREYPRWPSASTINHHFGRFTAGLVAAGLRPTPLVEGIGRQQRVEAARRLTAAGLSYADIADELGVSRTTVAAYLRAVPCSECGAWVTSGRAQLCQRCALNARRNDAWPSEDVVAAMRVWHAETGELPRAERWCVRGGDPRWLAAWPRFPTASLTVLRLGSWNAALLAAGLTDDDPAVLIANLRRFYDEHGRRPRWATEINRAHLGASSGAYIELFGSWAAALELAGIPVQRRSWEREEIVEAAIAWAREHERAPTSVDWQHGSEAHPARHTAIRKFGTWAALLNRAQLRPDPGWTRERILTARDRWTLAHCRPPKRADWNNADDERPAGTTVYNHFDSWAAFLAAPAASEVIADAPPPAAHANPQAEVPPELVSTVTA